MNPRRAYLIILAILLFIVLDVWTVSALTWQNETVDSGGYGEYTSMVLNAGGEPRISYYDRAHGDLRFAKNAYDGGGWKIETVDSTGDVGLYTSLVLNSAGNPCISYYDYTNSALKYAAYSGSAWTAQTVDSAGDVGLYTSLTLNSAGEPCISYYNQTNGDLKYAVHSASGWTIQTVDSAGDVGQYSSLARDNADEPCISYFDATNYRLKYAAYNGAAWQIQTVDAAGFAGMFSSLALDTYGRPRISCYDIANADLLYAAFNSSAWQIQTADSSGAVGKYSSIRLDGSGRPRISYYDETNQDLKYAALNGSSWQIETVDSAGAVGQYTSLVLDSAGNPQISYYDGTAGALKVAHPPLPAPTVTSISPPNGVLGYTITANITGTHFHPGASVRLSKAGYPDIPGTNVVVTSPTTLTCTIIIKATEPADYRNVVVKNADGQSGTIVNGFAVIRQGTGGLDWAVETVDSAGDVGWSTSIHVDQYGRPRISYLDWSNPALKYAEYNGSGWQITTVEKLGAVYAGTSLALNSAGNPRIGYHDRAAGTLKYAYYANATWYTSVVAPDGMFGQDASLVLDSATGDPRIAYFDYAGYVLKYASYNGSAWQLQSLGINGYDSSLALDSAGRPHISFEDASGQLRYASWTGSAWNIQTVDSTAGSATSLVLDSHDNPRISYSDIVRGNLKYAEYDGQAWHISTLDTGYVALSTSLALDRDGHPVIAYSGPSNNALKYTAYNGTAWNFQTIDTTGPTGYDISMVLDKSDNVHISYRYMQSFNPTNGDLKYAEGKRIGGASVTPSPTYTIKPPEIIAPGDITPVTVPSIVPVQPHIIAPGDITPVTVPDIVPVQPHIIAPGDITPVTVPDIGSPSMPGLEWPSGYGKFEAGANARGIYYNDQLYVFSLWYKGAEPANKKNYGIQLRYFKDNTLSGSYGMWGGSSQAEPTPLLVQVPNGSELMFIFVTGENGNIYFTRVNGSEWPDDDWLKIKDATTGQYITTKRVDWEVAPVFNPITSRIYVYYAKDWNDYLYWVYSDDYGNTWKSGGKVNNSPIVKSPPGAVFYTPPGINTDVLLSIKDINQNIRVCYLLDGTNVSSEVLPAGGNVYGYGRPFLIDLGPNIALMYAEEHGDKTYCADWYNPMIRVFNKTTQQWGEPYQAFYLPDLGAAQGTYQFHWQPNGAFDSKSNTFYLFYSFELCAMYTDQTNNGPWWMFTPIKTPGT